MPNAFSRRALLALGLAAGLGLAPASADVQRLTILAPAAPGGGWDQTARAIQTVLQESGIVKTVEVQNVAGAGGTIGLAQFATNQKGKGDQMMVGGLVMVGAIQTNKSAVTLDAVTPLARLLGEYEVIVVPKASKIQSMKELVAAMKADPGSIAWAGGSAGGTDHILVGLIAKSAGIQPDKINYVPFSGGGEAVAALLANDVAAGVSGLGEFLPQIASGELRALAISAPERLEGADIPTLKEGGVDVDLINWRGVFAPAGITPEQRAELLEAVDRMAKSPAWNRVLSERGWLNTYLPGDEFASFLAQDRTRIEGVLKDIGLVK